MKQAQDRQSMSARGTTTDQPPQSSSSTSPPPSSSLYRPAPAAGSSSSRLAGSQSSHRHHQHQQQQQQQPRPSTSTLFNQTGGSALASTSSSSPRSPVASRSLASTGALTDPTTSPTTLSPRIPFVRADSSLTPVPSDHRTLPPHPTQDADRSSSSSLPQQPPDFFQYPTSPRLRSNRTSSTSLVGRNSSRSRTPEISEALQSRRQSPSSIGRDHSLPPHTPTSSRTAYAPHPLTSRMADQQTSSSASSQGTARENASLFNNAFDPLFQQLTDVRFPPGPKEKTSLELGQDDMIGLNDHSSATPSVDTYRATFTPYGLPERRPSYTPTGFVSSSNDGDTSSQSASVSNGMPSRTNTPFLVPEWTDQAVGGMATDYESAAEGDAFIPMDGKHFHEGSTPLAGEINGRKGLFADGDQDIPISVSRQHTATRSTWVPSWLRNATVGADNKSRYHRLQEYDDASLAKSPASRMPHAFSGKRGHFRAQGQDRFQVSMLASPRQLLLWALRCVKSFLKAYHPLTLLGALVFVAGFVVSTTFLIIYILNPDKEPLPWRTHCAQSKPFPHEFADSLAPVDVFVGVMTMDSKFERRSVIRSTYASHTKPVDPATGNVLENVQLKFILGRPRKAFARKIALEMEMYNDIVVIDDMEENMAKGKSYRFYRWASENATVPILKPRAAAAVAPGQHQQGVIQGSTDGQQYDVAWKLADYVVKADDDTFIMLDELERHLRVSPRKMTYWGYLVKGWFMAGEAYALSADLIKWIATSPVVAAHVNGKEDTLTARWLAWHPNATSINYVSEHCWLYDHPKAGTPYSHGYLFPDEVERIKKEERHGLSPKELERRGGPHKSKWYSTTTVWHKKYSLPRADLSIDEEVEALTEGGGLWKDKGFKSGAYANEAADWQGWGDAIFQADDARLMGGELTSGLKGTVGTTARLRVDWQLEEGSGLPIYGAPLNSTGRAHQARGDTAAVVEEEVYDDQGNLVANGAADDESSVPADGILESLPLLGALKHLTGNHKDASTDEASQSSGQAANSADLPWLMLKQNHRKDEPIGYRRDKDYPPTQDYSKPHIPPQRVPKAQHVDWFATDKGAVNLRRLREERYLMSSPPSTSPSSSSGSVISDGSSSSSGSSTPSHAHRSTVRGGTIVVHYLKHNEWFFETALALIGRDRMRKQNGYSQWTMWGSPNRLGSVVVGQRLGKH